MGRTVHVLNPVAESRVKTVHAPALPSLEGRTVGFIDNRKTNFDHLVRMLSATLKEQHGVATVIHRQKAHAAIGAGPELLAEMVRSCDLVITGSAD